MPGAGQPTPVQRFSGSRCWAFASEYRIRLPNASLAGNCLIIAAATSTDASSLSISDDQSNTWSAVINNSVVNSRRYYLWICINATAGTRAITITSNGGNGAKIWAGGAEFYNVATASAIDGSATINNAAGPNPTAGTIATTVDGDLIWSCCIDHTNENAGFSTDFAAGNGGSLLTANKPEGLATQYVIQGTHGNINPTLTCDGTDTMVMMAVALKAADAGIAPSATPRIIGVQHQLFNPEVLPLSALDLQFPCFGQHLVLGAVCVNTGGNATFSGISDGNSNVWAGLDVGAGSKTRSQFAGNANLWYAKNATTGADMSGPAVSMANAINSGHQNIVLWDVVGILDLDDIVYQEGIQTVTGNVDTISISPAVAGGIMFVITGINAHTLSGAVSGAFEFDVYNNPLANGAGGNEFSDNGCGHRNYSAAGNFTFSYTVQNNTSPAGIQDWTAVALAMKTLSGGGVDQSSYRIRNDDGALGEPA
jgi:hypothetical protein